MYKICFQKRHYKYSSLFFVFFLTFIVYLPALGNKFVWDDIDYISKNLHIRTLDSSFFNWAFFGYFLGNWHPLTWISHALDYALWGLNPLGHHLTSISIHAANTFLLSLLCVKLMEMVRDRAEEAVGSAAPDERRTLIAAGVTGLLFGLHPIHAQSVLWLSDRKDLLCTFFFLLSVSAFTDYVRLLGKAPLNKVPSVFFLRKFYLFTAAFFILSLMSKPMAVTLPVVLLILDWYPFRRIKSLKNFGIAFVEKMPLICLSFLLSVVAIKAQSSANALELTSAVPLWARLLVGIKALIFYLRNVVAPLGLSPYYPYPMFYEVSLYSPTYQLAVFAAGSITIAAAAAARKQMLWLTCWVYYVVTLVPVSGVVMVGAQSMADRYAYLPSVGPLMIAGVGTAWIWGMVNSLKERRMVFRACSVFVVFVIILAMSYGTFTQIGIWQNNLKLWSYVISIEPERLPFAYLNRGAEYVLTGQFARAISDYDTAIAIDPTNCDAYNNRGLVYEQTGDFDTALEDFSRAIALQPSTATTYNHRARVYRKMQMADRALSESNTAILLNPFLADAYNNRGQTLKEIGWFDEAVKDFSTAILLDGMFTDAYINRGQVLGSSGKSDLALSDYARAISLNPSNYLPYLNRGLIFSKTGRTAKAFEDFTKALSLKPDSVRGYLYRGELSLETGNLNLAVSDFQKACDLGDESGCKKLGILEQQQNTPY